MNPEPSPNLPNTDLDPNNYPTELHNLIHQVNEAVKAARLCYERSKSSPLHFKEPVIEALKRIRATQASLGGSVAHFLSTLAASRELEVSFYPLWTPCNVNRIFRMIQTICELYWKNMKAPLKPLCRAILIPLALQQAQPI